MSAESMSSHRVSCAVLRMLGLDPDEHEIRDHRGGWLVETVGDAPRPVRYYTPRKVRVMMRSPANQAVIRAYLGAT